MAVLAITASEVKLGPGKHEIVRSGNAGELMAAGQVVYLDDVAKSFKLGDSTNLATAKVKGMLLNPADPGQPVDVVTKGKVTVGASAAIRVGGTYVVSNVPGSILEENDALHDAGKFTTVIGVGIANDIIDINPIVSDSALA